MKFVEIQPWRNGYSVLDERGHEIEWCYTLWGARRVANRYVREHRTERIYVDESLPIAREDTPQ